MLIFIKQLWFSCVFNFDSRTELISTVLMVTFNRRPELSGQSLSRTNPIRRHGACHWAAGLRRGGSRSCVCELFERAAVGYKTEWFGYRRNEHCDVSRNQHNVVWYNVADTGIFTRVCLSAFLSFHRWNHTAGHFILLGIVSVAGLTNPEKSQAFYRVRKDTGPSADHAVSIVFLDCSSVIIMCCELSLTLASASHLPTKS